MGHEEPHVKPGAPKPTTTTDRLVSLDAYRGFVMLAMVSAGLGTKHLLGDPTWGGIAYQLEHVAWVGCTFWDLIQPSFMFIVGVAMPFAFGIREAKGDRWGTQFAHAVRRALLLIAIGIFLDSYRRIGVEIQFIRVLQQIAIGYLIAFLALRLSTILQGALAAVLLVGHTLAFELYGRAAGVDAWAPKLNLGFRIDTTIHDHLMAWANHVNQKLVGTDSAWSFWPVSTGDYVTINAISSAATIVLGVLCGELLRSHWSSAKKLSTLLLAGIACLALGWCLAYLAPEFYHVPMIKRIWTSSFGIFAAGWTFLMIFAFYLVIDICKLRLWAFPFVVVGMNSIAIYVSANLLKVVIPDCLKPFVHPWLSQLPQAGPVIMALLVVTVQCFLCYWLYRHRIFFRV